MNEALLSPPPGSYLAAGYSFSPYGNKMGPGEEGGEKAARASPTVSKASSESKALDILHQHASQYKSKSPTVSEKTGHERERGNGEREMDRPRATRRHQLQRDPCAGSDL